MIFWYVISRCHSVITVRSVIQAVCFLTFFDCTADLVGQLNGNEQKGMLQVAKRNFQNFLRLRRQGGTDPLTKILRTFLVWGSFN